MQAGHEVAVPRAQPERVSAEDRGALRATMGRLDDREDRRAPAVFAQPGGELDVLVIGEEALIEELLTDRGAAIERRRRGNAPSHRQHRAKRRAVADLAKGAVADVDAGAVDETVRPADDGLHRRQLVVAIERI